MKSFTSLIKSVRNWTPECPVRMREEKDPDNHSFRRRFNNNRYNKLLGRKNCFLSGNPQNSAHKTSLELYLAIQVDCKQGTARETSL